MHYRQAENELQRNRNEVSTKWGMRARIRSGLGTHLLLQHSPSNRYESKNVQKEGRVPHVTRINKMQSTIDKPITTHSRPSKTSSGGLSTSATTSKVSPATSCRPGTIL